MPGYFSDIKSSISTVLIGMRITWSHMFTKKVTIQYPSVKRDLPERTRNRLYVNMDDCIGCDQCAKACPVNCITIETIKALPEDDLGATSTGNKKRLYVPVFDIDIGKCCYCGLCVYPCPTECIVMTDVFEFSEYKRHDLIYRFGVMTPEEITDVQRKADEAAAEKERQKAEAAAAKKKLDEEKKAAEAASAAEAAAKPDADAGTRNSANENEPPTEA